MRIIFFLFLLFSLLQTGAPAQSQGPYGRYLEERLDNRQFEKEDWEAAKEGLDFSENNIQKKAPEPAQESEGEGQGQPETQPVERNNVQVDSKLAAGLLRFISILILAVVLALILRGVLGLERTPRNKKIRQEETKNEISLEKIEENIHESDLDAFIRQAREQEAYALAIRLYYLSILKALSLRKAIRWKRDKTNRQYIQEMRQSPLSGSFEEVTHIYEQAWYGKQPVSRHKYQAVEPKFQTLARRITDG